MLVECILDSYILQAADKGKGRASPIIAAGNEISAPTTSVDTSDADFQLASKIDVSLLPVV